jgi:hypothetical protein
MSEAVADGRIERASSAPVTEVAPRAALATLGAALAAAVLVPGSAAGLGLALAACGILLAAAVDSDARRSRWRVLMLVAAAILSAAPVLRDAGWLLTWDLLLAFVLAGTALAGSETARAFARAAGELVVNLFAGPYAVLHSALRRVPGAAPGALPALARGSLLAVVLVAVFAALFASADGAFAEVFGGLSPDLSALHLAQRIGVAVLALALGGALAVMARWKQPHDPTPAARHSLAPLEWEIALGSLCLLFAIFVGVQFVVLFGGQDHVLDTAGLTYAEYARQGFAQLVAAAVLVLGVVAAAMRYSRADSPRRRLILHALLAVLCALTLVVLLSAAHRLDLYVDAFGATRMRVAAAAACVWIAGVLVAVGVALFTPARAWLPRAVALLTAVVAIAVTAANPDALIASRNVDRYQSTGSFDRDYNQGLSADAVPELMRLPSDIAETVLAEQAERLREPDGLLGFNAGRSRARGALDDGSGG